MSSVCIYFRAHQPNRLKPYTFFELGKDHFYEDDKLNKEILDRVSESCYLPANRMFMEIIQEMGNKFKLTFSLSGVFLEQLENHRPDVLESFQRLFETDCVEVLGETYYHSLAYLYSKDEFQRQIKMHEDKVFELFGQRPTVFRNTELIYYNDLAAYVEKMGYKGILAEGVSWYLNGRSPNHVYQAPNVSKIKTLLKNFKMCDDVTLRFGDSNWVDYPLTAEKFASWVAESEGEFINMYLDYETIGEYIKADHGIFGFWKDLPRQVSKYDHIQFKTTSEIIDSYEVKDTYDVHLPSSWADSARDLSAWIGNSMQAEAIEKVYGLESYVKQVKKKDLLHIWSKLQTSDHYFYLSTKENEDGKAHDFLRPYDSAYTAYIYLMNALSDLEITLGLE